MPSRPALSAATSRRTRMPASLFAEWAAGAKLCAQYGVTPATAVTCTEKPSDPAALPGLIEVADEPELPDTRATAARSDDPAVTAVARPRQQWLPEKLKQKQCGIRRNPSNPEIRAL